MCIMEIHAHANNATMVQALAHNASTIDRDVDMIVPILEARGQHEAVRTIKHAQDHVHHAYADFLELFGEYAALAASDTAGHVHQTPGAERTLESVVDSATRRAKADETR